MVAKLINNHKSINFGQDREIESLLADSPRDPFLQHALALEYIKADNDAEARALFENILQKDPAYVGSYYHLAKLLERQGDLPAAIQIYESGMLEARKAGDNHAYNELMMAKEEIEEM